MPIASYAPAKQTLGQLLSSTSPPIRVPDYQRDFSWTSKHVQDLWQDLMRFSAQFPGSEYERHEYFLGSAVMVRTDTHHILLDGQQRLATATILLACLRDVLRSYNENTARQIQNEYIVFEDYLGGGGKKYKLELNVFDRDFFRTAIQDDAPSSMVQPSQRSHNLIVAARKFFASSITEIWKGAGSEAAAAQTCSRLARILTNHFGIVSVTSDDPDHAASIFETLNDRGLGLSTADLLRSWLLSSAPDGTKGEITRLWLEIFRLNKKDRPELAIRASWVSRYGDVKTRSLYSEIKSRLLTDRMSPLDYTRQLHQDAKHYRDVIRAATNDPVVDEVCRGLSVLKAAGCYATLIAARNRLVPVEQARVARALAALVIRHNIVVRSDPVRLEARVFEVARSISAGQCVDEAIRQLRDLSPTPAVFRAGFEELAFRPTRHAVARILLKTIENNRTGGEEKIIASSRRVHVEHVYPQNPREGGRWTRHADTVYKLGNLTLLGRSLNQQASNEAFESKRKHYSNSEFQITQEIGVIESWNETTVFERQKRLCAEAEAIWPESLEEGG